MGMLTILEKDAPCDDVIDWPLFYMNDFSLPGLRVENLKRAAQVLEADGYRLVRSRFSAKVIFDNQDRLSNIYETLQGNGISFDTGDLVNFVYQG